MKKIFTFLLTFIAASLFIISASAECEQGTLNEYIKNSLIHGSFRNVCTYNAYSGDKQIVVYRGKDGNENELFVVIAQGLNTATPKVQPLLCFNGSGNTSKLFTQSTKTETTSPGAFYVGQYRYQKSGVLGSELPSQIADFRNNLYADNCYNYAGIYSDQETGESQLVVTNNIDDFKSEVLGNMQTFGSQTGKGPDYHNDKNPDPGNRPIEDGTSQLSNLGRYQFSEYSVKKKTKDDTPSNATCEVYEKNLCNSTGVLRGLMTARKIVDMVKICVPLILIIIGSITLGSAVISNDSDAISKSGKNLFTKVVIGLIIFMIPTAITATVNIMTDYEKEDSRFTRCKVCFFNNDYEDKCLNEIEKIENRQCDDVNDDSNQEFEDTDIVK